MVQDIPDARRRPAPASLRHSPTTGKRPLGKIGNKKHSDEHLRLRITNTDVWTGAVRACSETSRLNQSPRAEIEQAPELLTKGRSKFLKAGYTQRYPEEAYTRQNTCEPKRNHACLAGLTDSPLSSPERYARGAPSSSPDPRAAASSPPRSRTTPRPPLMSKRPGKRVAISSTVARLKTTRSAQAMHARRHRRPSASFTVACTHRVHGGGGALCTRRATLLHKKDHILLQAVGSHTHDTSL